MNPLFDRLYSWIRSELEWDRGVDLRGDEGKDPDLKAAEEELEDFLRGPTGSRGTNSGNQSKSGRDGQGQSSPGGRDFDRNALALAQAYMELGLAPGSTWEDAKAAHRQLLREHHPDRHGNSRENQEKATKKSQRINEAFQTISKALGR